VNTKEGITLYIVIDKETCLINEALSIKLCKLLVQQFTPNLSVISLFYFLTFYLKSHTD